MTGPTGDKDGAQFPYKRRQPAQHRAPHTRAQPDIVLGELQ
jgi:hypothetical protein